MSNPQLSEISAALKLINSNVGGFRDEIINQLIDAHNESSKSFATLVNLQEKAEVRTEKREKDAAKRDTQSEAGEARRERNRIASDRKQTQLDRGKSKNEKPPKGRNKDGDIIGRAAGGGVMEGLFGVGLLAAGVVASLSTGLMAIFNRSNQLLGDEGLGGAFDSISGFMASPAIARLTTLIPGVAATIGRALGPIGKFMSNLPLVGRMFSMLGRVSGIFTAVVALFDGVRAVNMLKESGNEMIGPAELFLGAIEGAMSGFISLFGDVGHLLGGIVTSVARFFGASEEQAQGMGNAVRGFFNAIENILFFVIDVFEPLNEITFEIMGFLWDMGSGVVSFFSEMGSRFTEFVDNLRNNDIIGPVIDGIEAVWNAITGFFGPDGPIGDIVQNASEWLGRFGISFPDNIFERRTPQERDARIAERAARRAQNREDRRNRNRGRRETFDSLGTYMAGDLIDGVRGSHTPGSGISLPSAPGSRPMDVTGWDGFEDPHLVRQREEARHRLAGPASLPPGRRPASEEVRLIHMTRPGSSLEPLTIGTYEPQIRANQVAMSSERVGQATDRLREAREANTQANTIIAPSDNSRNVSVTNNSAPVFTGRGSSVNANDPALRKPDL